MDEPLRETKLLNLALRIADSPAAEGSGYVQEALQLVVESLDCDRAVLHELVERASATAIFEAKRPGVPSNLGATYWRSEIPTAFDQVLAGQPVLVHVDRARRGDDGGVDEGLAQILADERTHVSYGVPVAGVAGLAGAAGLTGTAGLAGAAQLTEAIEPTHVMTVSFSGVASAPTEADFAWVRRAAQVVEVALRTSQRHQTASKRERESVRRQRLEAIGLLAGSVAHDFNNLLQAFSGTADLLRYEPMPPQEQQEHFELLQSLSETGAELVSSLLVFARHDKLKRRPFDIEALLKRFVRTVVPLTPSNVEFEANIDPALGAVVTVPSDMEQAFLNVYNNAVAAMPKGGKLLLSARLVASEGSGEGRVRIELTDTGCGMSKAVLEQATEPFFTTKSAEEGTGLGLSMVHVHMQESGGKLELSSTEGQGTTIAFEYPRSDETIQIEVERDHEQVVGGTETILVVEDDAVVRRVACSFLSAAGYLVLSAPNGEAALKLLEDLPDASNLDLLITDAIMPQMGGRKLYEKLSLLGRRLPVIVCSGYSRGTVDLDFFDVPEHKFLQKPFTRSQLLEAVRAVLQ